jgi:hypothetical protein
MNKAQVSQVKCVTELFPKAPFNFNAMMHKPGHFPSANNRWEPGIRWETMLWQNPLDLWVILADNNR